MLHTDKSLTILITNIILSGYTGTEVAVRDLALELKNLGHYPMIYTSAMGGASQELVAAGISVVTDLSLLPRKPDIIHGQHHIETMQALLYFPDVPAIFVCHDRYSWHDIPPKFNRILAYVAVDNNCKERLTQDYQIPEKDIDVIYNWVDINRFKYRKFASNTPKRALIFSSYAKANTHLEIIEAACAHIQLPLDVIGFGVGKGLTHPETLLEQYDLVFAKAKCAIEAMSVGAAVILCDTRGLGEMVTSKNVVHFRAWNFGMRLLKNMITTENLIAEIQQYDPNDISKVTEFIRNEANISHSIARYVELYERVIMKWHTHSELNLYDNSANYVKYLLEKIVYFENIQNHPFLMNSLPINECNKIKLSWRDYPQKVESDSHFSVKVHLLNDCNFKLGSYLPSPIYFAYHWLYEESGEMYLFEGIRTPLSHCLDSQMSADYKVNIIAPSAVGYYQLVVTLVQEGVRWFDHLNPPIAIRTIIHMITHLHG